MRIFVTPDTLKELAESLRVYHNDLADIKDNMAALEKQIEAVTHENESLCGINIVDEMNKRLDDLNRVLDRLACLHNVFTDIVNATCVPEIHIGRDS